MDKNYEKIDFSCGRTIKTCVLELLKYKDEGKLAYGIFNGCKLYSDKVTMDSAHKEIVGYTEKEFDDYLDSGVEIRAKKKKNEYNLKIKDSRWTEFKERAKEFGFKMNDCNNGYFISFYEEKEYPDDTFELQIWLNTKSITIETSNVRYSGFSTSGNEFAPIFDLIEQGFVEKNLLSVDNEQFKE